MIRGNKYIDVPVIEHPIGKSHNHKFSSDIILDRVWADACDISGIQSGQLCGPHPGSTLWATYLPGFSFPL